MGLKESDTTEQLSCVYLTAELYPPTPQVSTQVLHLICKINELLSTELIRIGRIPWRRERLPTPVSWPGELHGLYSPWGHKESDTTE